MNEQEIVKWAFEFWMKAGDSESFPRSLEAAAARVLPLAVVKLPRLGLAELHSWLFSRGIEIEWHMTERRLRACLLAVYGRGIVFLDGIDSVEEQRFSLAHEIAHFICDYLNRRERVKKVLGQQAGEILDGRRQPTVEERLTGILKGEELATYTHLMERSSEGAVYRLNVLEVEDRADRLALELLAPRAHVVRQATANGTDWVASTANSLVQRLLIDRFGLPGAAALAYAEFLVARKRSNRSFRKWLNG